MVALLGLAGALALVSPSLAASIAERKTTDYCAEIAGQAFADPATVLSCLRSFPVNETIMENVLAVVGGALDFFTFEAEQLHSPYPFQESSVNLRSELARIKKSKYETDYDFNRDLYNVVRSLNDGHTMWFPSCYWDVFQNILPAPIQSLEVGGVQSIHIAPDLVAFINQLGAEFTGYYEKIGFNWQQYAGAKVIKIGGMDAYAYVDHIASTYSGNYLDHGVRVNSVFSSYRIAGGAWSQRLGDLAGPIFPDLETLTFELIKAGSNKTETVKFPYRASYIGTGQFTDKESYWAAHCAVKNTTNGVDYLASGGKGAVGGLKQPMAKVVDSNHATGVALPPTGIPTAQNVTIGDIFFAYILPTEVKGAKVGVMMVGSFEPANYVTFQENVVDAIGKFQKAGVTKVIVDVTDNGGGYICLGEFLHIALVGSDFGYGGFKTSHRANPLARKIVAADIKRGVNATYAYYAPGGYAFLNGTQYPDDYDYMSPDVPHTVNGLSEPTGQHNIDICTPFNVVPPSTAPFKAENIIIVGNGNCASTCAQFTTVMHERHNIKMVVFGGKPGEILQYKGMAGNQVLEWVDIDSEIKTALLKDDPLSPPDLLVDGDIRVNWRTAYSWKETSTPIAFVNDPATHQYPYTAETVTNPQNLWTFVAKELF